MTYHVSLDCQIQGMSNIYEKHFGYVRDGYFVDVGAYDGIQWSNTSGLARAGWRGLMIEPQHEIADRCRGHYDNMENVEVIECAISDYNGEAKLYLGGSVSTIVPEQVDLYKQIEWLKISGVDHKSYVTCCVRTLSSILRNRRWPEIFDVLSIDAEGAELDVLNGLGFFFYHPRMIIVEVHEESKEQLLVDKGKPVVEFILQNGYERVYRDHINTIFWKDL